MKVTPVLVVYNAFKKGGADIIGQTVEHIDKFPPTVAQVVTLREIILAQHKADNVIFLNIIPLRLGGGAGE